MPTSITYAEGVSAMGKKSFGARTVLALVAAAVLGLTACGSSSGQASSGGGASTAASGSAATGDNTQTQNVTLMVYAGGSLSWVGYLAEQQGYFAKNHLNVKFVTLPAGVQATSALVGGSLDVAELDPFNVAPVLTKGVKLDLLVGEQKSYWTLFGQKSAAGKPLNDVVKNLGSVGVRSVGGAAGRLGQYLAVAYGASADSVKQVADIGSAAFIGGHEPYTIADPGTACQLQAQGFPTVFSFFNPPQPKSSYPQQLQALIGAEEFGYWSTSSWANSHPAAVKDLQAALSATEQWAAAPGNVAAVAKALRASSFNIKSVSDAQFQTCVGQTVAELSPSFTEADATTWSTALKILGLAPNGLPASSTYFAPGLPQ
jgi:NitT/TauT family transport system substrate-binding protein